MLSLSRCTLGHLAARRAKARGPSLIVSMTAWKKESENNKRFVTRRWLEPAAAAAAAEGRENVSAQRHENAITPPCQGRRSLRPAHVTDSTKSAEVTRKAGGRWRGGARSSSASACLRMRNRCSGSHQPPR